ncbi:MAG: SRPBCC family protein [Promicromonosporaceae bacterium]|nr:SRPBCC family protein [Promicromonosporaceae bacterium]
MTLRTESRTTIAGSVDEVWAYFCDVGRWPEWAPTVLECWVRDGGPLQAGAWVEQRAKDRGWTHHRTEKVTAVEAPHNVEFAGTMGMSPARWAMVLEPAGDRQTEATMWIEVDLAGVMRAVPGAVRGTLQRVSNREMAAIKSAVESAPQGAGS